MAKGTFIGGERGRVCFVQSGITWKGVAASMNEEAVYRWVSDDSVGVFVNVVNSPE